jgi:uncharacterized protein (TIGR03435 family)
LNADFPLATYIEFAYKIQPTREQFEARYAHLPKRVQMDNYDIHARAAEQNPTKDEMRLMMQALLKERFGSGRTDVLRSGRGPIGIEPEVWESPSEGC